MTVCHVRIYTAWTVFDGTLSTSFRNAYVDQHAPKTAGFNEVMQRHEIRLGLGPLVGPLQWLIIVHCTPVEEASSHWPIA
ncbi:hypothetical protein AG1IA_02608 [Rhizoctonia solani AG-1 IA]|uniref:Uncharacterized protein n=1 Tax=Thanatephorus cucumeris (strain AG1-IA) TaxID=983506 RepID=L8X2N1_THACA|nr:hypothetical protein AG1IA_02608 [Rhizoctonia solani AG-1 IA]